MPFSRLVWSNVLGRPVRSALTLTGVGVAVGAVIALVGVSAGFERSLREAYESRGIDLLVTQAGKVQQVTSVLPESLGERIAQLPEVERVSPGLMEVVTLNLDQTIGVTIQGWPPDSFLLDDFQIVAGEPLRAGSGREVLLGSGLAEALGKGPGDRVAVLEDQWYTVAGVYESFNVFENGAMIMPMAELQELMLREGDVTAYAVIGGQHDRQYLERLQGEIESLRSGLNVSLTRDFAENAPELRTARALAWLTSSIALVVGAVGILNTMLMAVFERTREIAMMRAVGWRRTRVMRLVLSEAMLLALGGAVAGAIGAIALTKLLANSPAASRIVSGHIPLEVIGQGFVIAMVLGLLGGLYPAYRAARLTPIEGLRHE